MQQRTTNNFFPSSSLVLDTGFWMIDLRRLRKRLGGLCFSSLSFLLFFQKCSFTSVFWMNEGKSEQRRNTKMERVVRVKHLLTKTAHREQQQQFFPSLKKIWEHQMLLCVGGTGCKWRLRDGQSGSQCHHLRWPLALLQWLTGGGSLQWLLCLSSLVQLGAIPWLHGHWEHKLWALLALGYQLKPAWSKTTGSQCCWVSSLVWFWEAGGAAGLRAVSSSLRRRIRLSCLLCCLLQ